MSDQSLPTRGDRDVTPVARALFLSMLSEREQRGIETYGTTLQTHNGRDAVRDALEEAVDLFQYLVQIRMELADQLRRLGEQQSRYEAEIKALRAAWVHWSNEAERLRAQRADLENELIALRLGGAS